MSAETPPTVERLRTLVGIWLVIITPQNEVFVVQNGKNRLASQKVTGQLNCPAESYEEEDGGKFSNTIARAIREEVGRVIYDPNLTRPLALIQLDNIPVPQHVVAAPYLIPIEDKGWLTFDPQDRQESSNPQWVKLSDITDDVRLQIGPHNVPLFRSPMAAIAEVVRNAQSGKPYRAIRHVGISIKPEVYQYLEANPAAQAFAA